MSDTTFNLIPLMQTKGVKVSPKAFHQAVNLAFHKYESAVYDTEHREMWKSLPHQFDLLVGDCLRNVVNGSEHIRLLDIGCGTGLSTELLLATPIGKYIDHVDLLDTSPAMLAKCRARARGWKVKHNLIEGMVDSLHGKQYDLVLTCSVLHHIPDLAVFLRAISDLQQPGGMFIHLQDTNGDYLNDPELQARERALLQSQPASPAWRRKLRYRWQRINQILGRGSESYIEQVNRDLLAAGVITSPLTDEEIWSVTDIHDPGLPFSAGEGISIKKMKAMLPAYDLISVRAYAFFGKMCSTLPPSLQRQEFDLSQQRVLNGKKISAVWQRR